MQIRQIMLIELPYLLRTYSRSNDEKIMMEYFCQCCLSILNTQNVKNTIVRCLESFFHAI